jgi:hypothetical protein
MAYATTTLSSGSGIELLTPPSESTDELTSHYLEHLDQGDGPAYISFHAQERNKLISALSSSGFKFKDDGAITLDDPLLRFIFFVQDNRSPTDKPEHFAHPNSAIAMTGVWLALDDTSRATLTKLLVALRAVVSRETVFFPNTVEAEVLTVQNGRVVVLPKSHQLHDGRPVVGAEFRIRDVMLAARYLRAPQVSLRTSGGQQTYLVPPTAAHGLWLEFYE